jgi:NAD(P)H-flavin reductase
MVSSYTTTCIYKERLCSNAWEFKLKLEDGESLDFTSGQFVIFDVPSVDAPEDLQPRAYSIASSPSEKEDLTFLITYKEGGRASRWVDEMLKVGDSITMKGPFGAFTLKENDDKDYVFIGTGSGVVPFRSMILDLIEKEDKRKIDLFFGVRNEECVFWKEEFEELALKHSNLNFHLCLSQPSSDWNGLSGRVNKVVPEIITDLSNSSVYVCGNPEMVKDLKNSLLLQLGLDRNHLHTEGYV